jgi:aspartoacylase
MQIRNRFGSQSSDWKSLNQIQRVAIVGGTHGNELTGVYLVKKFEQLPHLIQRSSVNSFTLLANPKAVAAGRRYIDRDLNRCFLKEDLNNTTQSSYEDNQAKKIYQLLGPKADRQVDFIIDLHTTTANMGITIIPASNHPFNLQLAAYLCTLNPHLKIYRWLDSEQDSPFLRSISQVGCAIEVGAIAQGILDATLFQQTEQIIHTILDYLDSYNRSESLPFNANLTLYQGVELVDYPRNEQGELQAIIHPELQFKDYQPLHPDDPMFLTFYGQTIAYTGESIVYPVFINEAAYYEKGIAMCLTQQQVIHDYEIGSSVMANSQSDRSSD